MSPPPQTRPAAPSSLPPGKRCRSRHNPNRARAALPDKVERARKVAASTPVPAAQSLAPSRPSAASVSKQATEQNVINLRKVNLIGVYGSANSRRALVRLSNGRYKKVKVGDRLDGGSVSAIGSSELRYVKRGKNVVLTMPRG